MERSWRRDELEKMKPEDLRNILRGQGQVTSGYKDKLIKRILGELPPRPARSQTTSGPKPSRTETTISSQRSTTKLSEENTRGTPADTPNSLGILDLPLEIL